MIPLMLVGISLVALVAYLIVAVAMIKFGTRADREVTWRHSFANVVTPALIWTGVEVYFLQTTPYPKTYSQYSTGYIQTHMNLGEAVIQWAVWGGLLMLVVGTIFAASFAAEGARSNPEAHAFRAIFWPITLSIQFTLWLLGRIALGSAPVADASWQGFAKMIGKITDRIVQFHPVEKQRLHQIEVTRNQRRVAELEQELKIGDNLPVPVYKVDVLIARGRERNLDGVWDV